MKLKRRGFSAGVAIVALAAGLMHLVPNGSPAGLPSAQAQNLGLRVVKGRVVDANDVAVLGATVFLKNLKTKAIRSYSSDESGHYRFVNVDMAEDHELWAEKDGKKSAIKTVSTWDTRKEFDAELKVK